MVSYRPESVQEDTTCYNATLAGSRANVGGEFSRDAPDRIMNITTHFSTAPVCSWYLGTAWVEVDELILGALLRYHGYSRDSLSR